MRLFCNGLRIGYSYIIPPVCPGCGDRLTKVPGWNKLECPNNCKKAEYKQKIKTTER